MMPLLAQVSGEGGGEDGEGGDAVVWPCGVCPCGGTDVGGESLPCIPPYAE